MTKPPRVNKTKNELAAQAAQMADIQRQKTLVKLFWPFLQEGMTIYDAQTAANAVAGYINYELQAKLTAIKVDDLTLDLKNEKDSPIKTAMTHILEVFKGQNAKDSAGLLERFGKTLAMHSAHVYMKGAMSELKVEDIIA